MIEVKISLIDTTGGVDVTGTTVETVEVVGLTVAVSLVNTIYQHIIDTNDIIVASYVQNLIDIINCSTHVQCL